MKASTSIPTRSLPALALSVLGAPLLSLTASAAPPVVEDMGTIFPGVVELITKTDVGLQIRASGNPTSFNAHNLPNGLDIDRDTGYIDGEATNPGETMVTIEATNADGTGTFSVLFRTFEREPDLPPIQSLPSGADRLEAALDVTGDIAPFTQWFTYDGGLSNPEYRNFFYRITGQGEGNDLIRNANAYHYSQIGVRTYVMGPAQLTFTWYVNIENGWDFFSYYVNEDPVPNYNSGGWYYAGHHPTNYLTGSTLPADVTIDLGPGLNRIDWVYSKDFDDAAGGLFRCNLDDVRITGYADWADGKNLAPFEAGLTLDKERDGNDLLTEYALGLRPDRQETVVPLMSFEADGRAVLEIAKNSSAYGVTVDIERMSAASPGTWSNALEEVVNSGSLLRKREFSVQPDGLYRVKVTAP